MSIKKILIAGIILLSITLTPIAAQSQETLAVLDFTTEAVSKTDMNAIVEFLSTELFAIRKYTVIDVSQRKTILSEMEFSMSGCSDDTCALEIGKLLSAELIVVGNLSKIGSRYLLSVKMLETETSKTMGTANGKYKDLDELIDGLNPIAVSLAIEEKKTREVNAAEKNGSIKSVISEDEISEPVISEEPETSKPEKTVVKRAPIKIDEELILPITCTAGGIIGIGVGTYFIINLFNNSLPSYISARSNYLEATDKSAEEVTALYDISVSTHATAMNDLIIGASVAGAGIILTTVGIILFPPSDEAENTVSFLPSFNGNPGLIVRVSY